MNQYFIKDLITEKITGEWGKEPTSNATKVIRTTNFTNDGKLNLLNVVERDINPKIVQKKKLEVGDVIIEKSGGSPAQPVGRVIYFDVNDDTDYLCNNFTSILRPSSKIYPKYLFFALYYFHLTKKTLAYQNKTTGIINLQLDRYITTEKIPLPSLSEQQQIVDILNEADFLRSKRKQATNLLDEYIKSVFKDMFGNTNGSESKNLQTTLRGLISTESGKSSKGIVSEKITDIPIYGGNGINGRSTKVLYKGPVVIAGRVGQNCGVIHTSEQPCWVTDNAIVIKILNREALDLVYLADVLRHASLKKTVSHLDLPFINQSIILDTPIFLPPIELQRKYAEIFRAKELLKNNMVKQLGEIENQFQALMQQSFSSSVN